MEEQAGARHTVLFTSDPAKEVLLLTPFVDEKTEAKEVDPPKTM